MSARVVTHQRILQHVVIALASAVLLLWTLFPFVWILLTSLKSPTDIIAAPPTFVFTPTFDNYTALVVGEQREIQEAAKIDGCSWLGVLWRVILPLSAPGIAVTIVLGFMFCWNAFNYPLMLAGRQTFPVTVGASSSSRTSRCCGGRWRRQRSSPHCRSSSSA